MTGQWAGHILSEEYHIPIGLKFSDNKSRKILYFDNPAQGLNHRQITYEVTAVGLEFNMGSGHFDLELNESETLLTGVWTANEKSNDVFLVKDDELESPYRPQSPIPPFPYQVDSISFVNKKAGIRLFGTLTQPLGNGKNIAAVLVTGSGPQNRDEELLHHRPFAVIADFLTSKGITVLRYDDRGVNMSEGIHPACTSFDFAEDAQSAFAYLRDHLSKDFKIGFVGHSEGAIIAQIADSLVDRVGFHIFLAGPGLDIVDLMVEQNRLWYKPVFEDEKILNRHTQVLRRVFLEIGKIENPLAKRQSIINQYLMDHYTSLDLDQSEKLGVSARVYAMGISQTLYLKWWPYFFSYKPKRYLKQIKAPVLAINGGKDIQVTPDNLNAIKKYTVKSSSVTIKQFENLNHLMQHCHTCKITEYGLLTETISVEVLNLMFDWLTKLKD